MQTRLIQILIKCCVPTFLRKVDWQDYETGSGESPQDGQEVEFHYSAYNENGSRIDSSFQKGKPAKIRLGIKGLIPGAKSYSDIVQGSHRPVEILTIENCNPGRV